MTKLNLTPDAQKLYQSIENPTPTAQAIIQQASEGAKKPLDLDQMAAFLLGTCPAEAEAIQQAIEKFKKPDCNASSKSGSDLIELRFTKAIDVVGVPQQPRPVNITPRWDPMTGAVFMDKDDAYALFCNAADWRDGGQMNVMHLIGRESVLSCGKKPDLESANLVWDSEKNKAQVVSDKASVVKFEDRHDEEFEPGDTTVIIFFDKNGKETKRVGTNDPEGEVTVTFKYPQQNGGSTWGTQTYVGAQADTQALNRNGVQFALGRPVKVEEAKLQAFVQDRSGTQGAWTSQNLQSLDVTLMADRGLHREPGSRVRVTFLHDTIVSDISAKEDEWKLKGNKPQAKLVNLQSWAGQNIGWLLSQTVMVDSRMMEGQHSDATRRQRPLSQYIYADAASHVSVGGQGFEILGDQAVKAEEFEGRKLDAYFVENADGKPIPVIELGAGFMSSSADKTSLKGWRIDVGYRDTAGEWKGAESFKLKGSAKSEAGRLELPAIEDYAVFKSGNVQDIEIQVYNANGVPAQRLRIGLDQLEHREGAMPSCAKQS